jgi:hypothetical protein
MAAKIKTFSELLSEAPLSTAEDTITLAGALGRSTQAGKFVLTLGPGNSVTLDQSAVKGYQVIGGGVGQLLVQIDVDKDKVPAEVAQQAAAPFALATPHHAAAAGNVGLSSVASDIFHTLPYLEHTTLPAVDNVHTNPIADIYHTGGFPHPD